MRFLSFVVFSVHLCVRVWVLHLRCLVFLWFLMFLVFLWPGFLCPWLVLPHCQSCLVLLLFLLWLFAYGVGLYAVSLPGSGVSFSLAL